MSTTTEATTVDLYTLGSVSMFRKYTSVADIFATLGSWWLAGGAAGSEEEKKRPEALLFTNKLTGDAGYGTAKKAMTEAHKSQMVWFRHGWITFSRYMVINDLRLENVKGK